MPYARPTLTSLIAQAQQDIAASPLALDGLLPQSVLAELALAMAGFAYLHYDYQDWISRQTNPWSASGEFVDGWGAVRGTTRKPATTGVQTIAAGGHVAGTSIPAATGFTRSDGAVFASTAATKAAADGTAAVTIQAAAPGTSGNNPVGTGFTLSGSIAGIQAGGWLATGAVTTAVDVETDDSLKARTLKAWAAPAQGGSLQDWQDWALAVPGVTRAWIAPGGWGPGTVLVFFMMDVAEALYLGFPQGANGVSSLETRDPKHPAAGDQQLVADAIQPLRPVTALVYASGPIGQPIPFVIQGLGAANTAANQAAIAAALQDMFLLLGQVGGTLDPETGAAYPPIATSSWYGAIAAALGNTAFTVSSPAAPIVAQAGHLPLLGPITFAS